MTQRAAGLRFPYLHVRVHVDDMMKYEGEALLDTGFDGRVLLPSRYLQDTGSSEWSDSWTLADGSKVIADSYPGVAELDGFEPVDIFVTKLGDDVLIGVEVIRHFSVILDHGRRVIVEP